VEGSHAVSRFVDWRGTHVSGGLGFSLKPGSIALAKVGSSVAIAAWESEGFKRVVFGPDLASSDVGRSSAFPVFMQNVISWCVPPGDGQTSSTFAVGESSLRPGADMPRLSVPGAIEYRRVGPSLLATAKQAGAFSWSLGKTNGYAAANPPASELDLAPKAIPAPAEAPSLTSAYAERSTPLAFWAILALIVFLAGEWFLWRGLPEKGPRQRGLPERGNPERGHRQGRQPERKANKEAAR
jgi:hypothetical protein